MNEEKKKYRSGFGYASLPSSSGAEKLELSLSVSQEHTSSNYQSYSATDKNGKDKRSTHRIDWSMTKQDRFSLSPKTAKSIEIAVILIAMLITLCAFSTPIIIRETYIVRSHLQDNCTRYGEKNCSGNFTWSRVLPASNSSGYEIYKGSSCKSFLQTWQECAIGQNEDVFVNVSGDQNTLENEVSAVLALIAGLNNTECQRAAIPFLCQYVFPLRQCTNGDVYMPSKEQCLYVSTEVCTKEWQLAKQFVPSCAIFPQTHPPAGNSIPAIDVDNSSFTINVTCRDDFYEINNTCTPRCDKWEQSPHDTTIAVLIVQNFAAWLGLLVGIIVIISSCIRYKNMFTFPSVFLIYMTIGYCVITVFIIITSFDRPALYCSSKNLTESILNPTTFCTVAGATFHYFLVSITFWWFFHVCSIFYKVMFPFTAKRTEKYQKYIHLILVIIGILLPLPAVVVTLADPNLSYTIATFPPLLCVPRNAVLWYYSAMLVLNVLIAIGVSLFIPMFWVVHKHQGIFRTKKRALNISFAERKILFVLCYYAVFGVVTLSYFGLSTQDQDKFIDAVTEYFTCEYFGNFPDRCERKYFEIYVFPKLAGATYFLLGLIPVANLAFVIDWRRVNQIMKRFSNRCCHQKVHEVEVEEIHSNLSPHPDSVNINPSTLENSG